MGTSDPSADDCFAGNPLRDVFRQDAVSFSVSYVKHDLLCCDDAAVSCCHIQ